MERPADDVAVSGQTEEKLKVHANEFDISLIVTLHNSSSSSSSSSLPLGKFLFSFPFAAHPIRRRRVQLLVFIVYVLCPPISASLKEI